MLLGAAVPPALANGLQERGNQLNPDKQPPALVPDKAGLNIFQRDLPTPTGVFYQDVRKRRDLTLLGDTGWQYNLSIEAGYLDVSGDTDAVGFTEYGDWSQGLMLNRFRSIIENPETALYLRASGVGMGRDDQFVGLTAGKYGKFELSLAYDTTCFCH